MQENLLLPTSSPSLQPRRRSLPTSSTTPSIYGTPTLFNPFPVSDIRVAYPAWMIAMFFLAAILLMAFVLGGGAPIPSIPSSTTSPLNLRSSRMPVWDQRRLLREGGCGAYYPPDASTKGLPTDRPAKVLIVIPGMGPPHLVQKRRIFARNAAAIAREAGLAGAQLHYHIFQYDIDALKEEEEELLALARDGVGAGAGLSASASASASASVSASASASASVSVSMSVTRKRGAVSSFLREGVPPSSVQGYDLLLILLDDVELPSDFSLLRARAIGLSRGVDIIALPVSTTKGSSSPHTLMHVQDTTTDSHVGRIANMAELFAYIMDPAAYARYWSLLDPVSEWGWGVDFALLAGGKMCVALLDTFPVTHHFSGEAYTKAGVKDPRKEMKEYGKRHKLVDEPLELARF